MSGSTSYTALLASAHFGGGRIERIFIKETLTEAIRFSDWRGGRFNPRALEIAEDELLVLLGDAIEADVFSPSFVTELLTICGVQGKYDMRYIAELYRMNGPTKFTLGSTEIEARTDADIGHKAEEWVMTTLSQMLDYVAILEVVKDGRCVYSNTYGMQL